MSFNYSDFRKYTDNFKRMSAQFETWLTQYLLNEGMRFIAEVKPRTPVDTGDLRSHWRLDGITRAGPVLQVWFVNPMEYATYVEYGHAKPYKSGIAAYGGPDWVDGYFMMTASIAVIERKMPIRFESEFRKFLLSLGVL